MNEISQLETWYRKQIKRVDNIYALLGIREEQRSYNPIRLAKENLRKQYISELKRIVEAEQCHTLGQRGETLTK